MKNPPPAKQTHRPRSVAVLAIAVLVSACVPASTRHADPAAPALSVVVPPAPPLASPPQPPRPPRPPTPEPTPWAGLYLSDDAPKQRCALVPHAAGTWLACINRPSAPPSALDAVTVSGTTLTPLAGGPSYALVPGESRTGGWGLRGPSFTMHQHADPYFAAILAHLASGKTFRERTPSGDGPGRFSLERGLVTTFENGKGGCTTGMLFPDPSVNASRPIKAAKPPPPRGQLGVRAFAWMEIASDCGADSRPTQRAPFKGGSPGVFMFADADADPLGIIVVGYMHVASFVAPHVTDPDLRTMAEVMEVEMGHAAE